MLERLSPREQFEQLVTNFFNEAVGHVTKAIMDNRKRLRELTQPAPTQPPVTWLSHFNPL